MKIKQMKVSREQLIEKVYEKFPTADFQSLNLYLTEVKAYELVECLKHATVQDFNDCAHKKYQDALDKIIRRASL